MAVAAPWPSPFELAAAGELERRLERALSTLSPQHREVVCWSVTGLDATDAAVVCGSVPGAAPALIAGTRSTCGEIHGRRPLRHPERFATTVDRDDEPRDDVLASLARLRGCDVSHAARANCAVDVTPCCRWSPGEERSWIVDWACLRHIVPALGGAWCLAYLAEIVRCTAAIYGYSGTP